MGSQEEKPWLALLCLLKRGECDVRDTFTAYISWGEMRIRPSFMDLTPKTHWKHRFRNFPGGPVVKTPHFQCREGVWSLVWELRSHVPYDWATSLSLFTFMLWRRKWQPTPVFLPGESQGRGSLVGSHRVGHDWSDLAAACCTEWPKKQPPKWL